MFAVFGYAGVVGYQPAANETVIIYVTETYGEIEPKVSSPFVFEYSKSSLESRISMKMIEVETAGANPPNIATLRQMTNYPSIYDDNAVFMGEFDRKVRRDLSGYNFLSIWNEQIEEEVRGANVENKNVLFVSVNPASDSMKRNIRQIIADADDSYVVRTVSPVISNLVISVSGKVARVYSTDSVEDQIKDLLLSTYGEGSDISAEGMSVPMLQQITDLLKGNIQALQDVNSDFKVTLEIEEPMLPEHWHYATTESITVSIEESNVAMNKWGR